MADRRRRRRTACKLRSACGLRPAPPTLGEPVYRHAQALVGAHVRDAPLAGVQRQHELVALRGGAARWLQARHSDPGSSAQLHPLPPAHLEVLLAPGLVQQDAPEAAGRRLHAGRRSITLLRLRRRPPRAAGAERAHPHQQRQQQLPAPLYRRHHWFCRQMVAGRGWLRAAAPRDRDRRSAQRSRGSRHRPIAVRARAALLLGAVGRFVVGVASRTRAHGQESATSMCKCPAGPAALPGPGAHEGRHGVATEQEQERGCHGAAALIPAPLPPGCIAPGPLPTRLPSLKSSYWRWRSGWAAAGSCSCVWRTRRRRRRLQRPRKRRCGAGGRIASCRDVLRARQPGAPDAPIPRSCWTPRAPRRGCCCARCRAAAASSRGPAPRRVAPRQGLPRIAGRTRPAAARTTRPMPAWCS